MAGPAPEDSAADAKPVGCHDAKLADCLDEEATALMNCVTALQGMQGDLEHAGRQILPQDKLLYWQTMARLAQVRGRLIEIRGY